MNKRRKVVHSVLKARVRSEFQKRIGDNSAFLLFESVLFKKSFKTIARNQEPMT